MPARASDVGLHSPMGATPTPDGTTLRCWAPSAKSVHVLTSATDQPSDGNRLNPLGDGTWAGLVPDLREGASYLFWVNGPQPEVAFGSGRKRDPYARELTLDPAFPNSFCIVRDPATYPWHDAGWHSPAFSDLIIYQLHIGTWQIAASRSTRGARFSMSRPTCLISPRSVSTPYSFCRCRSLRPNSAWAITESTTSRPKASIRFRRALLDRIRTRSTRCSAGSANRR